MRILYLTSRLPYPPNRGDRHRTYHFLRTLGQAHELHLLSFIENAQEREYIPLLQEFCASVEVVEMPAWRSALTVGLNLWRPLPLQALYYRSAEMQRRVDAALAGKKFDLAYIHLFRMAPFLAKHTGLYRMVDLTDVVSLEIQRSMAYRGLVSKQMYGLEGPRIWAYEQQVAREFEECWLVSPKDAGVLKAAVPEGNIQIVGIGVNTNRLYPTHEPEIPHSLVLVGHLSVYHNVDAARHLVEDILPLVRKEFPDTTVKLVGAEPNETVQALGNIPGVTVTGFVEDLNQALNQASVFAAPLRFAAGVQTKVLEAMAAGRPVVTSSLVNGGVGAEPGRDLLVADTPEGFAAEIIRLFKDAGLRQQLGANGRQFVQERFTWEGVLRRVEEIGKSTGP